MYLRAMLRRVCKNYCFHVRPRRPAQAGKHRRNKLLAQLAPQKTPLLVHWRPEQPHCGPTEVQSGPTARPRAVY